MGNRLKREKKRERNKNGSKWYLARIVCEEKASEDFSSRN